MKQFYLLFIILLLLAACKMKTKVKPKPIKNITFNVGFYSRIDHKGVYKDKATGKEYLYFADPTTKKCIKFFNLKGELRDSISLKSAIMILNNMIGGINIVSKDTIIITQSHYDKIIFINHLGQCWQKLRIDSIVGKENYKYSTAWFSPYFATDSSILIHIEPSSSKGATDFDITKNYFQQYMKMPYFIQLTNIYSTQPYYKFGLDSFQYKNISHKTCMCSGVINYKYLNQSIFLISGFSNNFFQINLENLKLVRKIKIQSPYTTIGVLPIKLTQGNVKNRGSIFNSILNTEGLILHIFFNENTSKYTIILRHQKKSRSAKDIYSVMVYDENFNKLHEYVYKNHHYNFYDCFMTQEGLLVRNNNLNKNPLKISYNETYSLFHFTR